MNKHPKFVYIPSFSAGAYGNAIKNDLKFKNGYSVRLYDDNIPYPIKHDWFLAPAGHNYKKLDYRESIGIEPGGRVKLFGDSGGFQIATGALKWDAKLKEQIFHWLEHNADFAVNLDIPPKFQYQGKYEECLEISKKNFQYFYENQTGKTKFLNVLQGGTPEKYQKWYDQVGSFEFKGWCLGGCGDSLQHFISAIAVFVDNNEYKNPRNEILHILGTSKIIDFFILAKIQHLFHKLGSSVQVTTDSSSPNNTTRFGGYYTHYDLKKASYSQIHVPKPSLGGSEEMIPGELLPRTIQTDDFLSQCYTYDDMYNMTNDMYCVMVLHNFVVFKEAQDTITDLVTGHPYIMEQMCHKDCVDVCNLLDKMVMEKENGGSAVKVYKDHKYIIDQIASSTTQPKQNQPDLNFF